MADSLLRSILETPHDDGLRLDYADAIEERGEYGRAEYIRKQIEYSKLLDLKCDRVYPDCLKDNFNLSEFDVPFVEKHDRKCPVYNPLQWYRELHGFTSESLPWLKEIKFDVSRGFPAKIRCKMTQWSGMDCVMCDGRCQTVMMTPGIAMYQCKYCKDTGHIPGLAHQICSLWPITQVELTDRRPFRADNSYWYWADGSLDDHRFLGFDLPELFVLLDRDDESSRGSVAMKGYATRELAISALSRAAVTYGRRQVGLPDLPADVLDVQVGQSEKPRSAGWRILFT